MADNVEFTVGADATPPGGTFAATDELADGSHAGKAKLLVSANGDGTAIPATAADGLLVNLGTNNDVTVTGSVTTGGLTDAQLRAVPVPVSGTVTATGGLTDAELRATPVPVSGTVTANAGTNLNTSALALEAGGNLAAAATSLGVLDNIVSGSEAQVDIVAPLPAGTNNIGDVDVLSLPALPAGNNNIGDVDIASSVLPTGASTLAEQQTQTASLSVLDDWDETNRAAVNAIAGQVGVAGGTGTDSALTQRVSLATNVALPAGTNNIGDVDVLTLPAIPAGTNNIGDVDVLTMPVTEVVGDVAADAAVPANPLATGGRASTALPTAVSADGDSVYQWLQRTGAAVIAEIPHLGLLGDPYAITAVTAQYTTAQTSTVLINPGASQRIAVTYIQIQVGGTVGGTLQVYFGTGAYSRGTSLAIFDGEFLPSATLKPGFTASPAKPWISAANDDDLRVTNTGTINPLTVTVWFYLIG